MSRVMLRSTGLSGDTIGKNLDETFRRLIIRYIDESELDGVVLLAQDLPHTEDGRPLPDKAGFYVPNDYLMTLCREHPEKLEPAISIHPARPDAMEELNRWIGEGVRILKLLPNCHNVDTRLRQYRPFWERMAEAGMFLLAHTGGEQAVPVLNAALANPDCLTGALECGVRVIAAHGAGRSAFLDPDYSDFFIEMMKKYPNLYCDNSALNCLNRAHSYKVLLRGDIRDRVFSGSDFPVPVWGSGPWLHGLISRSDWMESRRIKNPLQRDVFLKHAVGFGWESYERLDSLLGETRRP